MRAIVIYFAIAALALLAAYIIRGNSRFISNALLIISAAFLVILGIAVIID
jgi:hypothetical protein|tara:strand:- start:825 stop:977 length:153 start_codon:yes stop_codon:yes gene_type:complete